MKPSHSIGIVIGPRKPKGGPCCEKCRHLRFRTVIYKYPKEVVEPYCSEAHDPLEAKGCADFDDVSIDRSNND